MFAVFDHIDSLLGVTVYNAFVVVLVAATLCLVAPFFLLIAAIGAAGTGAAALGSRWRERGSRYYRGRLRQKRFLV
jgi:hypothetical protein